MRRKVIPLVSLILLLLALSTIAAIEYGPYIQSGQRYPSIISPAQAYLFSNGTLYLPVYNTGNQPVSLNSIQVAFTSATAGEQFNSIVVNPNSPLSDGSVKIFSAFNGGTTPIVESTEWKGGGIVNPGSSSLLRFNSPNPQALFGEYYLAVGNQWFYSSNLEPFTEYVTANDSLPDLIPIRAIVYPNETMNLNIMNVHHVKIGSNALVNFTYYFQANSSQSAFYSVLGEGNDWFRLVGGENLPQFMQLTEGIYPFFEGSSFNNPRTLAIFNLTREPIYFEERIVQQIPPILAPNAQSISSTGSADSSSASLTVSWQITLGAGKSYDIPVTIYAGQYSMSSTVNGTIAKIGNLNLSLPSHFATPYFNGTIVVTMPNDAGANTVTVSVSFGSNPPSCSLLGNTAKCYSNNAESK